jgi:hypothetical protein
MKDFSIMSAKNKYKVPISVAEQVHFCPALAPACQKFRLRPQLEDNFPHIIEKNSMIFNGFQKNVMCFKDINDHQKVL